MNDRRLYPPSGGHPPPVSASLGTGQPLDLRDLAQLICRRYRDEFPDEEERYGAAVDAWCVHDNQHLLNWAAGEVRGIIEIRPQVEWLGRVLEARSFPLDRLARNLDLAADVARAEVAGPAGEQLAAVLADTAAFVRSRDSFLD